MSKKILNDWAKEQIYYRYCTGEPISHLAGFFHVSRQTVRRALNEIGITTKDQSAFKAQSLLNKYKLSVEGLEIILRNYYAKYKD